LRVLSIEQAVAKLTSVPARLFGIADRGELRVGAHADLMLFDGSTVDRGPKQIVSDLPGGGKRLMTPAIGVHGVWVNGTRVADANGPCVIAARLPGKLLRQFDA
jgi:N-acyl-D-amino-acid deacylase